MNILFAIQHAKLVQINGYTLLKRFACDPAETLRADDIVLKAWADGGELELTLDDVTGAVELEQNAYRLRSGAVLCLYRRPTIH
jgi:hypothetical protein